MKAWAQSGSRWLALLLLHSACTGCAWISYSEPDSLSGFSEPIPTGVKRKLIRVRLPPDMTPAFVDGFKKGASALEPYYLWQPFHDTIVTTSYAKVIQCQLDVSTDASLVWRLTRGFLNWLTLYLVPHKEEQEYTLAFRLLVDKSEVKTATYIVKERYYRWLFATQAPSSLTGEWMRADENPDPNRSPVVQRRGEIFGKTAAAFCRDRQTVD